MRSHHLIFALFASVSAIVAMSSVDAAAPQNIVLLYADDKGYSLAFERNCRAENTTY